MDELAQARKDIDAIDSEMARLFERRMKASEAIAAYKAERGLPVKDPAREAALIEKCRGFIGDETLEPYFVEHLENMIDLSCRYQTHLIEGASESVIGIHTSELDYEIVVERGALARVGELLDLDRKALIVTDSGVPSEYAQAVASQCADSTLVVIERGEASKCVEQWQRLLSTMLEHGFGRDGCVVAVGGGVVGDLSGFAAACYMRGIDFYNVPTTLLSQVDSSIGGQTAIDLDGVKNIVGAFYQPKKVIIDPDTLATLDRRQLMAGLAETIKMAATCDAELFELIERSKSLEDDLLQIIKSALAIKKRVVEEDPTEKGLRRVLNFGHTIGHAIEALEGGELLHGECVALGMLPMCSDDVRARLAAVLERYGLPTKIQASAQQLMPYIAHDKKRTEAGINVVLVDEIGSFRFELMSPEDIEEILERAI